jgi:hypothetical protein
MLSILYVLRQLAPNNRGAALDLLGSNQILPGSGNATATLLNVRSAPSPVTSAGAATKSRKLPHVTYFGNSASRCKEEMLSSWWVDAHKRRSGGIVVTSATEDLTMSREKLREALSNPDQCESFDPWNIPDASMQWQGHGGKSLWYLTRLIIYAV